MLGSDFELFMKNDDGEFVPEVHLGLPDKGNMPIPLKDKLGPAGFIHRDNVSVEMCSLVAGSAQEFINSVSRTLAAGKSFVEDRLTGVRLGSDTTIVLPDWVKDHDHAKELGCDADNVASSESRQSVVRDRLSADILGDERYAGGHVHISYVRDILPPWVAALLCDLFIGLPMKEKLDENRAPFYGLSSLHRETNYPDGSVGVEYRSLDSGWVHDDISLRNVAAGAGIVQSILEAQDVDTVMGLLRVRTTFPDAVPLTAIEDRVAKAAVDESYVIAMPYVDKVLEGL